MITCTWSDAFKALASFVLLLFWVTMISAQPPIVWQRCYGGSGLDEVRDIKQTIDSGYIVAALSASFDGDVTGNHGGNGDYWILKIDSNGNIQWQKCLGGSQFDEPFSICLKNNGGFIVAGSTTSNDGDVTGNHSAYQDIWIVQLDSLGNIEWKKCFGGTNTDIPAEIKQTSDSGYIIIGETLSNNGDITNNHGDFDIWVLKLDSTGTIEWQNSFGGSNAEFAKDILETSDGYILTGTTLSTDGDVAGDTLGYSGCWLVKLNRSGNLLWQVPTGAGDTAIGAVSIQLKDNYFIVEGDNNFFPINRAGYSATKIDSLGQFSNWHSYGDWNYNRYSKSSIETSDSGFLITGLQRAYIGGDANYFALKIDSNFAFEWEFTANGGSSDDYAMASCESNGEYLIAGFDGDGCSAVSTFPDCWLIKLSNNTSGISNFNEKIENISIIQNNDMLDLNFYSEKNGPGQIRLLDLTGRELFNKLILVNHSMNSVQIQCDFISNGIYFVNIQTQYRSVSKKIVVN
ncbi:hypothetical protein BH11BAC1_BH11BAC1_00210 [soil metagenome]